MRFLLILLIMTACASKSDLNSSLDPVSDNFLIAFDKCRSLAVNLKNGQVGEVHSSPFDVYCKVSGIDATCDYFQPRETKRFESRGFKGGLNAETGIFKDESQMIKFDIKTNFAYFEGTPDLKGTKFQGKKICSGVFIFEREARKKK